MTAKINGILESALYFEDLEKATAFYTDLFDFEILIRTDRLVALNVAGKQVLLLFQKDASGNWQKRRHKTRRYCSSWCLTP